MKLWYLVVLMPLCGACSSSDSVGGGAMCAEPAESPGTWAAMALPPPNVGALKPAFAWTGNELIVWGGLGLHTENGGCVPCNGGGAYDPTTNSWRALSLVGAPTPRDWTRGVWTGSEFITWGGLPKHSPNATDADKIGGIYNLARGEWKNISTDGQPGWRWQHVFEWSGREVLVWGGVDLDNHLLCDGGRFDPIQNAWLPMNLDGAPAGCLEPARVWTGYELLVWGGGNSEPGEPSDEKGANTGAAYNPETDSWRPISNVGAPSGRFNPASIWTGEEMIVYGGNAGVDARAYNPTTDRWRSLNLLGAPGLHTRGDAVWTGSEMILWGHSDCDVGGRYDLASDTWQPFSSKGALTARAYQSLIWTGDTMIVYGGTVGTHFTRDTNSGALYTP